MFSMDAIDGTDISRDGLIGWKKEGPPAGLINDTVALRGGVAGWDGMGCC